MKNKFFRTALSLGLAVSMVISGPGISASAEEETVTSAGENEAQETKETFEINDAADFIEFVQNCRIDSWSRDRVIELKADVDLSGKNAAGIASFSGTFRGNGHTISGVSVQSDGSALGLFCYVEKEGKIEELNVKGRFVTGNTSDVIGAIAGVNAGEISGCSFDGTIRAEGTAGGIAGVNGASGKISGCTAKGTIVSSCTVGGIAGENRGTISKCENEAEINADTSWVDEETDTSGITSDLTDTVENVIESGSDIGGITGLSSGVITGCVNNGTVGYLHTGKNVGGIAGRQSGKIVNCENTGFVYGKQDVGGIAGQDEPFIKEEEVKKLKDEIETLRKEFDTLSEDMSAAAEQLDADADALGTCADRAASLTGDSLSEAEQMIRDTSEAANDLVSHISEASGYLQDSIGTLQQYLGSVDLSKLAETQEKLEEISEKLTGIREKLENISDSENSILDEDLTDGQLPEIDLSDTENLGSVDIMERLQAALTSAQGQLSQMAAALESMDQIRIPDVSEELISAVGELKTMLTDINNAADTLCGDARTYADQITADLDRVNGQAADIADAVSDRIDALENAAEGLEAVTDESTSDPENDLASRINNCRNSGTVYGDTNTAGIAGNVSRESSTTLSLITGKLYDAWLMIENCENDGIIHVKNRYAGGIAGYTDEGVIRDCTGAGYIYADSGSCLGGIMGGGSAVISGCTAAAVLEGSSCIGGIAGSAEKISDCLSLVWISPKADRTGAILGEDAGEDSDDVTVSRLSMALRFRDNYFCSDALAGIDGVSYEGAAEPVTYEELAEKGKNQAGLDGITVTYIDEADRIIGTEQVDFGTASSALEYPEVTSDEGCYIIWTGNLSEELTCSTVLRAEQTSEVKVLSALPDENGNGRILVAGSFTEQTCLQADKIADYTAPQIVPENAETNAYRVTLTGSALTDTDTSEMRIYVGEHEQIYVYRKQGSRWKKVDTEITGHYAEVTLTGTEGEFLTAVWDRKMPTAVLIAAGAAVLIAAALVLIFVIRHRKRRAAKKR